MQNQDQQQIRQYLRRDTLRRIWKKFVQIMACLVVFCTTYALILPAITMEKDTTCGLDHAHDQSCYGTASPENTGSPPADLSGLVIHTHDALCYDPDGNLICPMAEVSVHIHGEDCYAEATAETEAPETIPLETVPPTAEPAVTVPPETFPAETTPPETVPPETEPHVHDESCYATEQGQLICQLPEQPGHIHQDTCYEADMEPSCTPEEPEHAHTDACYGRHLICQLPEQPAHTHGDECYQWEKVLQCQLPEQPDIPQESTPPTEPPESTQPPHTDVMEPPETTQPPQMDATEKVLVCTLPEIKVHIHESACYGTDLTGQSQPICGKPEISQHQHTDACLFFREGDRICGHNANEEHTHLCYTTWQFLCQLEDIPSDPTADRETREDWEETMVDVVLTGLWHDDLLRIAETQLGYRESKKNFEVTGDGSHKGYTRYGSMYGLPYEDWCAMFICFCLEYAGVEDFPTHYGCKQWTDLLAEQDLYRTPDEYVPKAGDLVFFDWKQRGTPRGTVAPSAQHVGIVAEVIPTTAETPARIRIIEGNSFSDDVGHDVYDMDNPVIVGYGLLPEGPAADYTCGMQEHTHGTICRDENDNLICQLPEHIHEDACITRNLTYTDGTMRVEVSLLGPMDLPEDLTLEVLRITREDDREAYGAMYAAVGESMFRSAQVVDDILICQLRLLSEGAEYHLPEYATARVHVSFTESVFTPDAVANAQELQTVVLVETPTEQIEASDPDTQIATMSLSNSDAAVLASDTEQTQTETATENEATYQAVETADEGYENPETGITGLSFTTNHVSSFAMTLSATSQEGGYWKRVTAASELNANDIYMIISPEGNYALTGNTGTNATRVNIELVKGNPGYYTITDDSGADVDNAYLQWNFTGSSMSYAIQNPASGYYLNMSSSVLSTSSTNVTLAYLTAEESWTMQQSIRSGWWGSTTYYLSRSGTDNFSRSNNSTAYTRSVMIYKLVTTTLEIPDDVVSGSGGSGNDPDTPEKPDYPPYVEVTGGLQGDTTEGGVQGSYYSDPSTSQIESVYRGDPENNGRVLTDKSVIYMGDDYNAFAAYENNTFGVTLSALGQEYLVEETQVVMTPIDVVFILDVSGSMKYAAGNVSRAEAMVDAVNQAIQDIMTQNPENRVGITLFSSGAWDLLELGHYYSDTGQYIYAQQSYMSKFSENRYQVFAYDNIRSQVAQPALETMDQANGTYTQAGIAKGSAMLERATPKTYTAVLNEGTDYAQSITVRRQPVIILLSDGEPTHCNPDYRNVLSGPHYGDGVAQASSYQGVYGYYTILSANYYKRMVGIAYDNPALFYTVGMGISEDQDVDLSGVKADSDVYKRAVLNPTVTNITTLSSTINGTNTTAQLKALMQNTYTGKAITVANGNQSYMSSWMGQVHAAVPVLPNPYPDNYSYAEKAYFGQIDTDQLKAIFSEILLSSYRVNSYGFILQNRSHIELMDPVGEGMEVKGDPILRYGGVNYTHTSSSVEENKITYVYDYDYAATDGSRQSADLSQIIVEVITEADGTQTVHMDIPDMVLPAHSPYLYIDENGQIPFYYEALPVRLIYQVGLTEEAKAEIADLAQYGGSLTYYTNRYENINAHALMKPTNANPYYQIGSEHDHDHGVAKTANVTDTFPYSFECHHDRQDFGGEVVPWITQVLGNNGKLVFEAERKVIDIPVQKQWGASVDQGHRIPIDISLYTVADGMATLVKTVTLSADNSWQAVFDRLPVLENGFYAVAEQVPVGYAVEYGSETTTVTIDGKPVAVVAIDGQTPVLAPTIVITNYEAYQLPETGGVGTQFHTFGGLLLMLAAALMYICKFGRKWQKGGGYSE